MSTQQTVRIRLKAELASGRRRGWFKLVESVDSSKRDGYAFVGEFLREGENDLPLGAVVVEQVPVGSARQNRRAGYAYRVTAEGLEAFAEDADWDRNFLSFRDAVATALAESKRAVSSKMGFDALSAGEQWKLITSFLDYNDYDPLGIPGVIEAIAHYYESELGMYLTEEFNQED